MRVTFIGMGRMGRLMASHIVDAGHELVIWNRTPGKAAELTGRGAVEAPSLQEAVRDADAIVLMLFGGDSSLEVLEALAGVAPQGALVIDSTTTGPDAARLASAKAREHGLRYVDAPVAGSLAPAEAGTLTVFVGGSEADVEAARPLLELWGEPDRIRRVGEVGAANALKSVVNMCLGVAMAGVGEALRLGADLSLDQDVLLNALEAGPFGWSIKQKRPMLDAGEFNPTTFSLELMVKDLTVALSAGSSELPLTAAALKMAEAAVGAGLGGDDYAAMAGFRSRTN